MGKEASVEDGVRETLKREGVKTPSTALEILAIEQARKIDNLADEKNLAPLSRELRLTLESIHYQAKPSDDAVAKLASTY